MVWRMCFIVAVLSLLVFRLGEGAEQTTLSLPQLFERAKGTHPEIELERLSSKVATESQSALLGAQDWRLTATGDAFYKEPLDSPVPGASERDRRLGFSAELSRADWNTGSRVAVGASSGYGDVRFPGFGAGSFSQFQNRIFAEYSLSLLRNARGALDRLAYDLAAFDINLADLQAEENNEEFLLEMGTLFLDWVYLEEQIRILDRRLAIAQEELERTQRRREQNLIDEIDVLRAEDAVRMARQNQLLAVAQWKAVRVQLATRLADESIDAATPDHDLYSLATEYTDEILNLRVRLQVRPLQRLEVVRHQLERNREGLENAGKPSLDLVAGGALEGGDNSYLDSLGTDRPEAYLQLRWSQPLGNRTVKADLRKTDLQILQVEIRARALELELRAAARALVAQMTELENVLLLNQEHITSAARRTEEELRLYNQGRGELNFVLLSRDNEANAEFVYAGNAATYQKLVLQLRSLLDELW